MQPSCDLQVIRGNSYHVTLAGTTFNIDSAMKIISWNNFQYDCFRHQPRITFKIDWLMISGHCRYISGLSVACFGMCLLSATVLSLQFQNEVSILHVLDSAACLSNDYIFIHLQAHPATTWCMKVYGGSWWNACEVRVTTTRHVRIHPWHIYVHQRQA